MPLYCLWIWIDLVCIRNDVFIVKNMIEQNGRTFWMTPRSVVTIVDMRVMVRWANFYRKINRFSYQHLICLHLYKHCCYFYSRSCAHFLIINFYNSINHLIPIVFKHVVSGFSCQGNGFGDESLICNSNKTHVDHISSL